MGKNGISHFYFFINKEIYMMPLLLLTGYLRVPKSVDEVRIKNDYKFRAGVNVRSSQQAIFNFA